MTLPKIQALPAYALGSLLWLSLSSCNGTVPSVTAPTRSKPTIVASYSVLCDLTRQIAEETIDLKCLIPGGKDPHTYSPTPDDRKAIETGKLVLYGGYDFEPSVIQLIKASPTQRAIAVHELAVPQPMMTADGHDHDHHDHRVEKPKDGSKKEDAKKEDAKPEADPHVWHNAKNGIAMVQVLKTQLSQVNPSETSRYEKNAKALTDRLSQLDAWIQQSINTIPPMSRKLITTHDALSYYSNAYGIPIEGALQGISTDEQPSAQRIKTLSDQIKATKIPTLFAELSANPKLIETVAREANVKLSANPIIADGLGEAGSPTDTYEKMMRENTKTIVTGLGGKLAN